MDANELRIVDAAMAYFDAYRTFERTQGDDESDKQLTEATDELLNACHAYRKAVKAKARKCLRDSAPAEKGG